MLPKLRKLGIGFIGFRTLSVVAKQESLGQSTMFFHLSPLEGDLGHSENRSNHFSEIL